MLRFLALIYLLSSNSWATSDSIDLIASDQTSLVTLHDSLNDSEVEKDDFIFYHSFISSVLISYLTLNIQKDSSPKLRKCCLYLTRAPPASSY
jgi:hypothetical protein